MRPQDFRAGRRPGESLASHVSFAIETTLASRRTLETMCNAKVAGFRIDLVYICLDTASRRTGRGRCGDQTGMLKLSKRV